MNIVSQSATRPTRISMGRLIKKLRTTYFPSGAAVHIEGPPGMAKSSMVLEFVRQMQAEMPYLGGCYLNGSNAQSIHLEGLPMQNGFLASSCIPKLFQPNENLGLRGVFPALCPISLMHPDLPTLAKKAESASRHGPHKNGSFTGKDKPLILPVDPDLAHSKALLYSQLATYEHNIVILDEVSKMRHPDDAATAAMLAYEGNTGQWGVNPKKSLRVLIANRADDHSRDMEMPATYHNRVAWYEVYLTFDDVQPHWQRTDMHPIFIDFAGAHTDLVLSQSVPSGKVQFCTARSFEQAHDECMMYCQNELQLDPITTATGRYQADILPVVAPEDEDAETQGWMDDFLSIISARCGDTVRTAFQSFYLAKDTIPDYLDVARDPSTAIIPTHAGVTNALLNMLVARSDIRDIKAIGEYITRSEFPPALAKTCCTRLCQKFPPVVMAGNQHFMALCNKLGVGATMGFRH